MPPPQATPAALRGASLYVQSLHATAGPQLGARQRLPESSAPPAGVAVGLYTVPAYDVHVPALPVSRLSVCLTAASVKGALEGTAERSYAVSRYALFLAPAGASAHWHKASPSRHLTLYFDRHALADCGLAPSAQGLVDEPLMNQRVPGLRALIDELALEMQADSGCAAEAADSLARLLLIRLARHRAGAAASGVQRNPLSPMLLQRLTDYVQAHLAECILVTDLAAVVGLSPNRFAHACTAFVGQSPHQFVMAMRLRQATAMLTQASASLADVAAACGFASQQHLTQVMRKRLGVTPARYRSGVDGGPAAVPTATDSGAATGCHTRINAGIETVDA